MMLRLWSPLLIAGIMLVAGCRQSTAAWNPRVATLPGGGSIQETPLGPWSPASQQPQEVISPDGRHVAYVVRRGRGLAVALDGKAGPTFSAIGGILRLRGCIGFQVCGRFSDDGRHFTYFGRKGSRWHCVRDGSLGLGYRACAIGPVSRPINWAGQADDHYAFSVHGKETSFFVVDGKPEQAFRQLGQFTFSPNGGHYAYWVHTDRGTAIIRDGAVIYESPSTAPPQNLTFSPDGRRFAYTHSDMTKGVYTTTVVLQGERQWQSRPDAGVAGLTFSADSRHIAYVEYVNYAKRFRAAVDGELGRPYEHVDYLCFRPQSDRIVYVAKRADKHVVLVDGMTESAVYDDIRPLRATAGGAARAEEGGLERWNASTPPDAFFSPDGRHIAYVMKRNDLVSVVRDGVVGQRYKAVFQAAYSADYRHLAYFANTVEGRTVLVVDGKPTEPFDSGRSLPVFSPDGKRLAYGIGLGDFRTTPTAAHMVIDGKIGLAQTMVSTASFSPDGQHVAYFAMAGAKSRSVMDGIEGPKYDRILGEAICSKVARLAPDGALEYLAIRDGWLYRFRHLPAG